MPKNVGLHFSKSATASLPSWYNSVNARHRKIISLDGLMRPLSHNMWDSIVIQPLLDVLKGFFL